MVWSPCAVAVKFRDIPQRHCFQCYFLNFNTLKFGYRYTEANERNICGSSRGGMSNTEFNQVWSEIRS